MFDKNRDGYIDEAELHETMKELGMSVSQDDVNDMFQQAGCQSSRKITYAGLSQTDYHTHLFISRQKKRFRS